MPSKLWRSWGEEEGTREGGDEGGVRMREEWGTGGVRMREEQGEGEGGVRTKEVVTYSTCPVD